MHTLGIEGPKTFLRALNKKIKNNHTVNELRFAKHVLRPPYHHTSKQKNSYIIGVSQ